MIALFESAQSLMIQLLLNYWDSASPSCSRFCATESSLDYAKVNRLLYNKKYCIMHKINLRSPAILCDGMSESWKPGRSWSLSGSAIEKFKIEIEGSSGSLVTLKPCQALSSILTLMRKIKSFSLFFIFKCTKNSERAPKSSLTMFTEEHYFKFSSKYHWKHKVLSFF